MRTWSNRSQKVYDSIDPQLQKLVTRIRDEVCDITLVSGRRDREEQNGLFANGFSKLRYPDSKHNKRPSRAVDLQPYPYPTDERRLFGALGYIAGHAFRIAQEEGITIIWGGMWDNDQDFSDPNFDDWFHIELA